MHVAIKYLRDTNLTIEDIADFLGFSEAANFRHAFSRWTGKPPQEFSAPRKRRKRFAGPPGYRLSYSNPLLAETNLLKRRRSRHPLPG